MYSDDYSDELFVIYSDYCSGDGSGRKYRIGHLILVIG